MTAGRGAVRARRALIILASILGVEIALIGLDAAFPPDLTRARQASPVALDRRGLWLRALPVESGRWRIRADLDRTDPRFLQRLQRLEDARFAWHRGVDPLSLARAVGSAVLHGRAGSGASTLTMQTARLLEPRPRTVTSKLIEMVRAAQLENRFDKRRILALYLTLAPYGGNLEGVRAASLAWFGHEPTSLTDSEQALLLALPQAPEARRPDLHPKAALAARARVLRHLARLRMITPPAAEEAARDPLPARAGFPSSAWHAAGELARSAPGEAASLVTTLDADLQARLEPLASQLADRGGRQAQAAILVVEVRTRAVRAAVASAGRDRAGGWIDLTRAVRSPGSTLKPFIYGLAFEQGLAAPDTLIDDAPRRFADYQPEDFDRVFHGPVTAREALDHSLNVPAVALLDKLGPGAFEARLTAAGVHLVRPKARWKDPGLALALGGEGLTLRDLALLYAALADGGTAKPLAWTEADAARRQGEGGVRLMRPEAARQVLDILREAPAPEGRMPAALTRDGAQIAFKTGTSYGFRDALAAGTAGGWVIVVWTGRADGGAQSDRTGRDIALPTLFDVADTLAPVAGPASSLPPKAPPRALSALSRPDDGPHLIFPPNGAVIRAPGFGAAARGLTLSAGGKDLRWFVDGALVAPDRSGAAIWRPAGPGFYAVTAVDGEGRSAEARVRVVN